MERFVVFIIFFFNDTATTEIYTLSLHDALPISRDLVIGTMGSLEEIDRTISSASLKWDMKRMAAVDRNLLRLASFELMFQRETPARVVLNEAIEMAKSFGGEESGGFINGILDRVRYDMGRQD